jgi:Skp family chaperone for outer membrane proteins
MIRKVVCLAVVATLAAGIAFVSGRLLARADDAAPGDQPAENFTWGSPVAVIDVASVFKNYESFQQGVKELKEKVAQKEQAYLAEAQEIKDLAEQLNGLDKLSEEYRELAEQVAARQSSLKVLVDRTKKELMTDEAKLYLKTHSEIQDALETYAKAHGIRLVLRHSDDPMDPDNPPSVMRGVNRNIVFQDGIDITEAILRFLNEKRVS